MKFRTELDIHKSASSIRYRDRILMLGSCFTENIGNKLSRLKYTVDINPLGIIYHPVPIHEAIVQCLNHIELSTSDLQKNMDGLYTHWSVHSRLCDINAEDSRKKIKTAYKNLGEYLLKANYLILSYGTAYYYEHHQDGIVANCHKFPSSNFEKKLSNIVDLQESFDMMLSAIISVNPKINIFLTISPVRHIKDGVIENNLSKAHLIAAVHGICNDYENCQYLPAYELLLDDLRDYRFYAEDLVHPSSQAIDYIWEKISYQILDPKESQLRSEIEKIVNASQHRPFNSNSAQHKSFRRAQIDKITAISKTNPSLNFTQELALFGD